MKNIFLLGILFTVAGVSWFTGLNYDENTQIEIATTTAETVEVVATTTATTTINVTPIYSTVYGVDVEPERIIITMTNGTKMTITADHYAQSPDNAKKAICYLIGKKEDKVNIFFSNGKFDADNGGIEIIN